MEIFVIVSNYSRKKNIAKIRDSQCGKPFFSNTRQNSEWTETSTRHAWRVTLTNYQINNTVMLNNLFCRF
jgi:hypothetical protein